MPISASTAERNPLRPPPRAPLAAAEADALIRREFAALAAPYVDVAARGPLPASSRQAAEAILAAQATGVVPKAEWLSLAETTRSLAAELIGAGADEIAFTKNVSEGLNIVGTGLPLGPGDRIVVAPSAEHPNNVFPWLWAAQQRSAEVAAVSPTPNENLEQAIINRIDSRTRLVAVTAVDFATGRRTDLHAIGAACRAVGAFLLVDAAQSSGVLQQDMAKLPVDGWATAAQKGLLAPYGIGLLYVRRNWMDRIRPAALARFSVEVDAEHEAAGPEGGWRLRNDARRYEVGNYNYIGLAALRASLDLLLAIGAPEVERRSVSAAEQIRSAASGLAIPVLPVPEEHRSHIL
ncbi:MAG TPA: aminotransferase class V-fold PLP-dependent enzyme, partial [Rhodopila sp.]|nr:aminotransferase class V-fold PLP-dependent enzyme [Rhodopila sp.]